jgi:hypothetical protein
MERWAPTSIQAWNVLELVCWGFPLTFFDPFSLSDRHCADLGNSIATSGKPARKTFSEVSAAALMAALGVSSIRRILEDQTPTPDWMLSWRDDPVELEVTQPEEKPAHVRRRAQALALAERLHQLNRPWDIVVFVSDLFAKHELDAIVDAGRVTDPTADPCEQVGKWHLYSEKPNRPRYALVGGGTRDRPPAYWSSSLVTCLVFRQWLAGPNADAAPPQIRVHFGVPVTGYLNPVQNKEASFQGSGEAPFVLALDVAELADPFPTFRRELPEWLQTWTRISGVLIFRGPSLLGATKIGWTWDFLPNPHALHKIPEAMFRHFPNEQPPWDTWAPLVNNEAGDDEPRCDG